MAALVRVWPSLKKIANEREANLLTERAEDMEAMRADLAKMKAEIKQQQVQHEAERAVDRHRINNLQACLDSFLMLIEQDPQKAGEAVVRIKEMRARQAESEAAEKAAIRAAAIVAASKVDAT